MKIRKIIFSVVLTLLLFVVTSCGTSHTHTYTDWVFVTEPTVTEGGQAKRECTDCHQTELASVPALSDYTVWTKESVDPTVETTGTDTYTSSYGVVVVVVDKIDYSNVTWTIVKEPTLTATGSAKYVYAQAGLEGEISIPNLADTNVWSVVTNAATCLEDGLSTYTSVYGTVEVVLPATGHAYGAWTITVEPTTTTEGKAERTCPNCSGLEEVVLPVLTDATVWAKVSTDATCTQDGKDEYTSEYGKVVITKDALGHSYGAWTITLDPTPTKTGTASRTCATCNDVETVTLPALTDTIWTKAVTPATCTSGGKDEYTSIYGTVTVEYPATGHNYGAWTITTEPTLTTEGSASHTCSACSEVETTVVPALTDTTVWEKEVVLEPTYTEGGKDKYTSVYGTVEVETSREALPYEGKTYSDFAFDAEENGGYVYGAVPCETAWNTATVQIGTDGVGIGQAYPFRGKTEIKLVDEVTGKIEITVTTPKTDDEGNVTYPQENATVYVGYVDFATGLIVRTFRSSFNYPLVYTPFEVGTPSSNAKSSSFAQSIAISYVYDGTTYNMFITNERVYFGVTFTDAQGNAVAAENCYNAPYVYVKDSEGKLIKGFAFDGEKEVVVDGLEGAYTAGDNTLTVTGFGTVSYLGAEGTYTVVNSDEGKLAVFVGGAYYDVVLNKTDKTCTLVKPMVTITFVSDKTSVEALSANKNITCVLPSPENADYTFEGWYFDDQLENKVPSDFVPTEDVKLYASWKLKVIITLVGALETDPSTIILGEGDVIGTALPTYTIDLVNHRIFKGWYLDEEYETPLPEAAVVTSEDTGIVIYAKWEDLAPYYGSYYITEIYNESYGNYSGTLLNIDENGNLTGKWTGIITEYNKEEQKITWKKSATATTNNYFWFDETTGLLVTSYSGQNTINNDLYVGILGAPDKSIASHYGLKDGNNTWKTRLLEYKDANGDVHTSAIYNMRIYADVTLKTTTGSALTVATIASSSTLVCCTGETCLFAYASNGTSFKGNGVVALDSYYGTYTSGAETVVLDGTGKIVYGDKKGTYTKVEDKEYGFDVYLENNTEYYELTLDGESFTIVKPMVTITFVTGEGHNAKEAVSVNKNIAYTLEDLTEANYVFNGWFTESTYVNKVTSVTPAEDMTVFAKWSAPAKLTIVYNNGEPNEEIIYSVGDLVTIEIPVYAKHCFEGWFTTEDYQEESKWADGTAITVDIVVYAKWSVAPVYNNKYMPTEITGTNVNGSTSSLYCRSSSFADIDPYGKAVGTSYPFRGDIKISDYDETTGTLVFTVGTTSYKGYIEKTSGIIIMQYSATAKLGQVYFLTPFETTNNTQNFSSSYWNSGLTRCIEYTFGGTTYRAFVDNEVVYFNVTFTDMNGDNVLGKDCYKASTLFVKDSEGNLIKKFGFDGTTMMALDGFEGTYTNGASTLVMNGIDKVTLDGVQGTYAKANDGASYMFDVYLDNGTTYYELTVVQETMTFTVNKPMVTVSYNCDNKAEAESVTVNKNIAYKLPVLTNPDYVFRGWYTDATYTTKVDDSYAPTSDITLFAKWDAKYTLTVVYGNTLDNATLIYGDGDTIVPVEPIFTNGKVFNGWYLDDTFTTKLTDYVITGNMTIYCNWKDAIALCGDYAGFETWGSTKAGGTIYGGTSLKKLSVSADGAVSGNFTGFVFDYNAETGYFKFAKSETDTYYYVGYYNVTAGILVYNYSSSKATDADQGLKADIYVFFNGATSASSSGSYSSFWNSGLTRLLAVTATGFAKDSFYVFIDGINVYYDVTFTSTDGTVAAQDAYKANQLSVFDSTGALIKSYTKDASNGLVAD